LITCPGEVGGTYGHPGNSWRRTVDDKVGKADHIWRQIDQPKTEADSWLPP